jgi:hypothetical protein
VSVLSDTIRYDTIRYVPRSADSRLESFALSFGALREPSAVADLDKLKGLMQVHMHMPTPTPTLPHRTGSQGQTSISQPLSFTKSRSTVDLDAE